ncbi:MAG TPA: selenocysteine-specific translation elongation factor [Candidatus Binatia bacterium]|nr:selenocysteine-specific translation elongation factor [Candidatus Binatia bacterium]
MSFVVGTAGHIDHGKSTLIHALTGVDPDRLAEEKRRGMTIDLGFASLTLPSGRLVGIVDVPGHARFIRNMLAGVHGLDAVLLVVAADEGVMPQTREHLEIVDLLEVPRGLVALTKVDLVDDEEWLALVEDEVRETLAPTSLAGAEVVRVSGATRIGLDELLGKLDTLLDSAPARLDRGRPRLPVDRVFTISGFGTVVTGTLIEGRLRTGEELVLQPSGRRVRVRGLQQHGSKVEEAEPGTRAAANLVGVDKDDLTRGDVLARADTLHVTRRIDASVRVLRDAPRPLRHGANLLLHTGTAEVTCRAIVLGGDEVTPGERGWLQLYLERPVAVVSGDRYVLREPSPAATVAGGVFTDVAPRRHARFSADVSESLARRAAGEVLQEELRKYPRGITRDALRKATLEPEVDLASLDARQAGQWLFAPEVWQALADRARRVLEEHHRAYPLRPGMPQSELRSRLRLAPGAMAPVLAELERDGVVGQRDGDVALPSHQGAAAGPADSAPGRRLLELLGASPFTPPSLPEAMREAGVTQEVVRALVQRGEIVRVSTEVAFTKQAYDEGVALVRELVEQNGSVTLAALRDRMGASRRPVQALLEYLDGQRITRRIGDERVLA